MRALSRSTWSFPSLVSLALVGVALAGCTRKAQPEPSAEPITPAAAPLNAVKPESGPATANAKVGAPAPDFTLIDLEGKQITLSSFRGKTVVLEWFNPGCPFVKASHTKGSLVDAAERHRKAGVVWLAINSGAPGKQGHGVDVNRESQQRFKLEHPILLDETGRVGRVYAAAHTPHLYVIDKEGVLVYRGAIDNSPDGEGESPTGGRLINYVDAALSDITAGRPVGTAETEAYGCSVKYGS